MKTSNENLNKALDNAFVVRRETKKHAHQFKRNALTRPMTVSTLFQILAQQNIEKSMHDCHKMMCGGQFATDYHTNYKSTVTLVVYKKHAVIEFKNSEYLNVYLCFEKLCEMFPWLADESIYSTDFKNVYKSELYYN